MAETLFLIALAAIVTFLSISTLRKRRQVQKRRDSLRQGSDGTYYWIDFDGSERRFHKHPEEQGGPWFKGGSDGDSSGGFDGGGGGGGD